MTEPGTGRDVYVHVTCNGVPISGSSSSVVKCPTRVYHYPPLASGKFSARRFRKFLMCGGPTISNN